MRFKGRVSGLARLSVAKRVLLLLLAWLVTISAAHYWLNTEISSRALLTMGYMPVVTNLACPLLDFATRQNGAVRFRALKFASFAEMAEALRHDQIQAAFMIAPLSIVLRQQGEDVKVIYIGNRHESTLVAHRDLKAESLEDLVGRTIAVPLRYSGHHLSLLRQMEGRYLTGQINLVEMNPPDMASALASGCLDAYFVGEPFAAQTLRSGNARLVNYVEDWWDSFICNLIVVKRRFIDEHPENVHLLVEGAVRSGLWAEKHPQEAARIVATYWNQPVDVVEYALTTPPGRILYKAYLPKAEEMQQIADLMVRYGLIANADISGLVDDRFARAVKVDDVVSIDHILPLRKSQRGMEIATSERTDKMPME